MSSRYLAITGLVVAVVGGILAFALKSPDTSVWGVKLQSLGAILLAVGALLVAAAGMMTVGGGDSSSNSAHSWNVDGLKAIGGLIAVVGAIVGVVALTVVTQSRLSSDKADSIVAIATAALGVISAIVGAYLGIKVTADQSANAQQQAQLAHAQLGAATVAAGDAAPEKREKIKQAMATAAEDAATVSKKSQE
jgi:hypothetical protein